MFTSFKLHYILVGLITLIAVDVRLCPALVRSNTFNVENMKPGDKIRDKITLHNDQDVPVEVELKQVDYLCNANGESHFLQVGSVPRSNANWITLNSKYLKIEPHSTLDVYFTILVPNDSDLKGSYSSLILIEPTKAVNQTSIEENKNQQVTVKVRYAYLLVTSFGNPEGELKIINEEVRKLANRRLYTIDIENKSNYFSQPVMRVNLFNQLGKLVMDYTSIPQKILPETSVRFFADINEFEFGAYKGIVYITDDKNQFLAKKIEFTLP